MGEKRLYECRACPGRSLTMQACEAVMRSAAELEIAKKLLANPKVPCFQIASVEIDTKEACLKNNRKSLRHHFPPE